MTSGNLMRLANNQAQTRRCLGLGLVVLVAFIIVWHALDVPMARSSPFEMTLFWELRLPRVMAAAAVGMLLACSGQVMQSVFRNPLAEPTLLGVSGGAALGAALGLGAALPLWQVQLVSCLLAIAAMLLVAALGYQRGTNQLILAGVAINALLGSLLSLFLTQSDSDLLGTTVFWLMGSLSHLEMPQASALLLLALLFWLFLLPAMRFLNHVLLGDTQAYLAGYPVRAWRLVLLLTVSIVTALCISQTGAIGFIALMAPHMGRLLVGGNNRVLWWVAPLIGALLCVVADDISRNAWYPVEMPIGIVTSLLGVPFFLWLLRQQVAHE